MGLLDNQTQQEYYDGNNHGDYQFTSLNNIVDQFIIAYVGEGKVISKVKRTDVAFHAQRALQELSFDIFKSCKNQEVTIPPSLTMKLPQDYVNYVKLSWTDASGMSHIIYPTSKTSNPTSLHQNSDGEYKLEITATLTSGVNNIELDDIYPNVARRMRVTGLGIPEDMFIYVHDDNTAGDKSIIILRDLNNNIFTPSTTTTGTLTFSIPDGSLLNKLEDGVSVMGGTSTTGFDTTTGSNILTLEPNSTQSISAVKEGMLAFSYSTDIIPEGTTVTQIDTTNNIIFLSNPVNVGAANVGFMFVGNDADSTTWSSYSSGTPSENKNDDYEDDTYWPSMGGRYGLDPQHAQANGSFYIDCNKGLIHFSSNISGKTVVLEYISDSLGTDEEMKVHKFAEEAMYKWIAHAILSTKLGIPEYVIMRYKKERFAEIRKAKIRLSNIKLEEITQILRGKSKFIKH
jgi:hypothetical protein